MKSTATWYNPTTPWIVTALGVAALALDARAGDLTVDNLSVSGNLVVTSRLLNAFNDKTPYGNHATSDGPVASSTGRVGSSCGFTAVGELHTPTSASLDTAFGKAGQSQSYTISMWINPASTITPTSNTALVDLFEYEGQAWLTLNESGVPGRLTHNHFYGSLAAYRSTQTVWNAGTWYHIACEWDRPASMLRMYINGALQSSLSCGSAPQNWWSATMCIGGWYESQGFSGLIDEVRLYNRALSLSEVQQLYSSPGSLPSSFTNGLVAYYDFSSGLVPAAGSIYNPSTFYSNVYFKAGVSLLPAGGDISMGIYTNGP